MPGPQPQEGGREVSSAGGISECLGLEVGPLL